MMHEHEGTENGLPVPDPRVTQENDKDEAGRTLSLYPDSAGATADESWPLLSRPRGGEDLLPRRNIYFGFGLCAGLFLRRLMLWRAYSFIWIFSAAILALGGASVYLGIERDPTWRMAFAFCSAVLVLALASEETRRSFPIPPVLLVAGIGFVLDLLAPLSASASSGEGVQIHRAVGFNSGLANVRDHCFGFGHGRDCSSYCCRAAIDQLGQSRRIRSFVNECTFELTTELKPVCPAKGRYLPPCRESYRQI